MTQNTPAPVKSITPVVIFITSLLVPLFWFLGQVINVYKTAFLGAVFEFLWFPMLILLFTLPVLSLLFWRRTKFNTRSLYFYSFIILIVSIFLLITIN